MRHFKSQADLYRWHSAALEDLRLHLDLEVTDDVQCGWFKRRLVKQGPWVPARIWLYQPIEDGELVGDEKWQCEVKGQCADSEDQWLWLCQNPITEAEYNYLMATVTWAVNHSPDHPLSDPNKPINNLKTPLHF